MAKGKKTVHSGPEAPPCPFYVRKNQTGAVCGSTSTGEEPAAESKDIKIALITMDSIDQHWITLNEGAQKAAEELGVTVTFMAPNTKDDAQQIEQVNNAVSAGCQAIVVAANGPDAISSALNEAISAGVKVVYVDSPANVEAEATFSTDNKAADGSVIVVGFDKSDAILGLIEDGFVLATMAQNPDVMGYEGVKAAVAALNGEDLGGAVTDTGVSVLTK